jgi:hypothetical protein
MAKSNTSTPSVAAELAPGDRVFAKVVGTIGADLTKKLRAADACKAAIGDRIDVYLADLDEEARTRFFVAIEADATAKQQTAIAAHPLRPDAVQPQVDAARERAKAQREAEKAERAEAKREREREEYERLKMQFEGGGEGKEDNAKPL